MEHAFYSLMMFVFARVSLKDILTEYPQPMQLIYEALADCHTKYKRSQINLVFAKLVERCINQARANGGEFDEEVDIMHVARVIYENAPDQPLIDQLLFIAEALHLPKLMLAITAAECLPRCKREELEREYDNAVRNQKHYRYYTALKQKLEEIPNADEYSIAACVMRHDPKISIQPWNGQWVGIHDGRVGWHEAIHSYEKFMDALNRKIDDTEAYANLDVYELKPQ